MCSDLTRSFTVFIFVLACFIRPDASGQPPDQPAIGQPSETEPKWTYTDGTGDAGVLRPVSRSFPMSSQPLDDLQIQATFRGTTQRYAQVRYGNAASVRVTMIIDELPEGDFHLYVDRNRDRVIQPSDLVEGAGRERDFPLNAVVAQEEFLHEYPRVVRFRRGISGNQFSLGTVGYVFGTAIRDDVETRVRLVDGDVNGLFADDRDRIWIDVNSDGQWNPLGEQFPFRPMLILGERRWAVRADRVGRQFRLEEVTGVGELKMTLPGLPESARVVEFRGMVYAEDGSVYSVSKLDDTLSVPVGRYTPQSLLLVIDTGEKQPWYFTFSRSSTPKDADWFTVDVDGQTEIDAVGQLRLVAGVDASKAVRPGASVALRPRLYTGHGLLINMSCRGRQSDEFGSEQNHNPALMTLSTEADGTVDNARSGFA